jgi:hypothetical protein
MITKYLKYLIGKLVDGEASKKDLRMLANVFVGIDKLERKALEAKEDESDNENEDASEGPSPSPSPPPPPSYPAPSPPKPKYVIEEPTDNDSDGQDIPIHPFITFYKEHLEKTDKPEEMLTIREIWKDFEKHSGHKCLRKTIKGFLKGEYVDNMRMNGTRKSSVCNLKMR